MGKKFNIKEKGTDFWGRKKYEVTESDNSGGEALGVLILVLLGLAALTIPAGTLALSIYLVIYNVFLRNNKYNLQNKKEKLAWISTSISIICCLIYYVYYFNFDNDKLNTIAIFIALGIFSYYALYKIVNWNKYDNQQKSIEKKGYITSFVFVSILMGYKFYNDYSTKKCLIKHKWINARSSKYSYVFKSNGDFQSTYDGGWTTGKWETSFFGDIKMTILDGKNFKEEVRYEIDFINCGEFKSGKSSYIPNK